MVWVFCILGNLLFCCTVSQFCYHCHFWFFVLFCRYVFNLLCIKEEKLMLSGFFMWLGVFWSFKGFCCFLFALLDYLFCHFDILLIVVWKYFFDCLLGMLVFVKYVVLLNALRLIAWYMFLAVIGHQRI